MKTVVEQIEDVLAAFKRRLQATAVALVNGDILTPLATSEVGPTSFCAALFSLECLDIDWGEWRRELLVAPTTHASCGCGGHAAFGFGIRGRWTVVVLASIGPGGTFEMTTRVENSYIHTRKVLEHYLDQLEAALLETPFGDPRGGGGGGTAAPAELGIPVGWVRQRN